jgi:SAM-dependent methyltransferase
MINPDQQQNASETIPPQEIVMQMITGAWVSQIVAVISCLDIPDILKLHGAQSALSLTQNYAIKADPNFLQRVLRAGASVGIFTENADGQFGATLLSDVLTTDSPTSVKKIAEISLGTWRQAWTGLADAIETGQPQAKAQLGMEYWDYCKAHPQEMEKFGEAMKSNSLNSQRAVLEHIDFSDVPLVADIGGGFGHLTIDLLKKYDRLQGIIVDIPELAPSAQQNIANEQPDIVSRIQFVGGDMFQDVPPANVYILKHIIHDWDDERCLKLLRNCYTRMKGDGRIICIDAVLPPMGNTGGIPGKLLDVNIMVCIPGKERTLEQWQALYHAAGFKIGSIVPIRDNFGTSIIEGTKVLNFPEKVAIPEQPITKENVQVRVSV